MFDIIHIYKSDNICFAGLKPHGDHSVYMSAYGFLTSTLLEKYVKDERVDNEDLFGKWDESIGEAASQVGFTTTYKTEDGYIYISSFQNGIGVSAEDEAILSRKNTAKREYDLVEIYEDQYDESDDETE